LRLSLVLPPLLLALSGLGCASKDPATRATVLAAEESEDAATCRQKSPDADKAYDACRKELAAARAQQSAVQEQKRRDFDRTLGAGTEGQDGY
jgi:type IV pilus biogenesis protein CpaD/CtpE